MIRAIARESTETTCCYGLKYSAMRPMHAALEFPHARENKDSFTLFSTRHSVVKFRPIFQCLYPLKIMVRSTAIKAKKRRKSQRLQNDGEASQAISIENVAQARRRSTSSSSSTSDESSSIKGRFSFHHQRLGDDGPYRRLRSSNIASRKIPAQVLNNSTNEAGGKNRKRVASTSSSSNIKKKKNPRVSISSNSTATVTCPPLTRRQRQNMAKQVTPSPAAQTSAGASFSFNSPIPKRRLTPTSSLPEGVIDLYPPKNENVISLNTCRCGQNDCSANALSASFINSYGKDYWTQLKEREEPAISPPSPVSTQSSTSVLASPSSSTSSIYSDATPAQRRDYVYIDTSSLEVIQPRESSLYLHYQPELTPKMRAILVDWIIELSEHFDFGPAALHLAVTLVDKVLACGPLSMYDDDGDDDLDDGESKTNCFLISRDRFQLLGAACTWLACKVEEMSPPSVSEIAYVSDNIYSREQIKRMERRICNALNFSLIHQTPYPYINEFMRASNECPVSSCRGEFSPVFHNLVLYLLELGRLPYDPVTKKPSLLAASAVYLARVTLGIQSKDTSVDPEGRWSRTLQYYTGYGHGDLRETVLAIHGYHRAAEETSLKSVFAKYKTKKYHRVALKTIPRIEDLGF
jgi:hypothetical protein